MKIHNYAKYIKSDKKNYVKHGMLQKGLKRKEKQNIINALNKLNKMQNRRKTMEKKLVSLLVVTAMVVGCMSGCGSENKKSDSANGAKEE